MCDIWKRRTFDEIGSEQFDNQLADIERLGVEWVVFSGGEALLHRDVFRKASQLRRRNIRVTLLSSGILIGKYAREIVENFDDLIVSLDGPAAIHDRIRGVERAFDLLRAGVTRIREERGDSSISARCTVQRSNCGHLMATVEAARELRLKSISFLASDTHSEAFNRTSTTVEDLTRIALGVEDLSVLDAQIEELIGSNQCGRFILESPAKLKTIAHHFRCGIGLAEPVAPKCNAPWTSAVIEADGSVRPCFFHAPIGKLGTEASLYKILNGPQAVAFRSSLNVATNPICRRCVCSLNWTGAVAKSIEQPLACQA
jgi:radical SAM protein with 4Fe4S-binding SPASM domain